MFFALHYLILLLLIVVINRITKPRPQKLSGQSVEADYYFSVVVLVFLPSVAFAMTMVKLLFRTLPAVVL